MLLDTTRFRNIGVKSGKEIMLQLEDRLISLLKNAKNPLSANLYKELYSNGPQFRIMYGLTKIYKPSL